MQPQHAKLEVWRVDELFMMSVWTILRQTSRVERGHKNFRLSFRLLIALWRAVNWQSEQRETLFQTKAISTAQILNYATHDHAMLSLL